MKQKEEALSSLTHNPAEQAVEASATRGDPSEFDVLWRPSDPDASRQGPEKLLLEIGQVTLEQIKQAEIVRKDNPRVSVLDILVQKKIINASQALQAVAMYFKLPFLRISSSEVDQRISGLLPVEYCKTKKVLPVQKTEHGIVVALTDPADIFLIDDIKRRIDGPIKLAVALPDDILRVLEDHSADPNDQVDEIIKGISEDTVEVVDSPNEDVADLEMLAGESPVIRYVNFLISLAVREGASDIHIEPGESRLRIRCRIDGALFDQSAPPARMHAAIISRLKIMANLDIAERRLPQDGRVRASVHGRTIDLRVSTLPVIHGEKCVIRILDARSTQVGLANLGFLPETLDAFKKEILQPHGIVLVTGPTGSGKSTTLYSSLRIMDGDKQNISTVEDPVEYELDFCNQVNVHESIGMTFAAALRSLLRQDPDVIMVGEIRDQETARIAIQSALTGHMVLSTLHTNDAPSSITRLMNIGVESFLISASLNGILAQRLVRRICSDCKEPMTDVPDSLAEYLQANGADPTKLWHGKGCDKCRGTGYRGRVGTYEFLVINNEMRRIISAEASLNELREAARAAGMRTLREDGLVKVTQGHTTVEEVMRVTEA